MLLRTDAAVPGHHNPLVILVPHVCCVRKDQQGPRLVLRPSRLLADGDCNERPPY